MTNEHQSQMHVKSDKVPAGFKMNLVVHTLLSQWCRHSPPLVVSTQSACGVDTVPCGVDTRSVSQKPSLKTLPVVST
ncbi:hypothetical protein Taro_039214 [Colocasia esculenta]|uniref:Uncharacterized protein n=1 Tax=Colocasia esculenta TaxID=4460 RepID=A0A843W5S4_COLES|nr:hypothetical protein [Colocasia esculenta]